MSYMVHTGVVVYTGFTQGEYKLVKVYVFIYLNVWYKASGHKGRGQYISSIPSRRLLSVYIAQGAQYSPSAIWELSMAGSPKHCVRWRPDWFIAGGAGGK